MNKDGRNGRDTQNINSRAASLLPVNKLVYLLTALHDLQSAVRCCRLFESTQTKAVPVFWIAAEDHDCGSRESEFIGRLSTQTCRRFD